MSYRRLKADRIFDGEQMHEGQLLLLNDDGTIEAITADDGEAAEVYTGILSPGFVNSHCHLELSHLKNKVAPGEGMVQFLIDIVNARRNDDAEKMHAIARAENEMW